MCEPPGYFTRRNLTYQKRSLEAQPRVPSVEYGFGRYTNSDLTQLQRHEGRGRLRRVKNDESAWLLDKIYLGPR